MHYPDRFAAGRTLGGLLLHLRGIDPLILGLPRGGVPVAAAVRALIGGDLDILLVRKLGVPGQPELAMGAIGEGGVRVLNSDVLRRARVTPEELARVERAETAELSRRTELRGELPPRLPLTGRTVVLVDDGMATGATAAAAVAVARAQRPDRIVVAVPVASGEALDRLREVADEVVCPYAPADLGGVGGAYVDFHQLTDGEVVELLTDANSGG
ncbi:phosphoribosyltransferase [Nocardia stercoris]|uniref:Phosphoribosyltransferase n=1 Tax=Nocardia stercoris TaxID=2483361 RepID=A0A3M2LE94_9NOCA|nr:phosphoribosyltransferase family protein [Nocardia stercoris]RMI35080.1 phosphoribosyltransferase [Nocardia stercoris]